MKIKSFNYVPLILGIFFNAQALATVSAQETENMSIVSQLDMSPQKLQELAKKYKEDDYYKVLDSTHSESPEITEYFSTFCGHCRAFEDIITDVRGNLPEALTFNKKHISWMGDYLGPLMTKAVVTAQQLGVDEEILPALFVQIQDKRNYLYTDADVRKFFIEHNVSEQDFDNTYNNVITLAMAQDNDQSFLDLGLRGVPSLIVNNKYLVQPKAGLTQAQYEELVAYLLTK